MVIMSLRLITAVGSLSKIYKENNIIFWSFFLFLVGPEEETNQIPRHLNERTADI